MITRILIGLAIVLTTGCNIDSEYRALHAMNNDTERVWAFMQFNVQEEEDGLESYYYYAEISESLYHSISNNQITEGFMLLENVKYWGQDDLIYDYSDIEYSGEIVFRIEDIKRISLVNRAPEVGRGYDQFEEPSTATEEVTQASES